MPKSKKVIEPSTPLYNVGDMVEEITPREQRLGDRMVTDLSPRFPMKILKVYGAFLWEKYKDPRNYYGAFRCDMDPDNAPVYCGDQLAPYVPPRPTKPYPRMVFIEKDKGDIRCIDSQKNMRYVIYHLAENRVTRGSHGPGGGSSCTFPYRGKGDMTKYYNRDVYEEMTKDEDLDEYLAWKAERDAKKSAT